MEVAVDLAMNVAQESAMEKRLGCVILYRRRVIAHSANYTVGTVTGYGSGRIMYNASMHSEMGAIEQLAKKMGFLQSLHHILSGRLSSKGFRPPKARFKCGPGRCQSP